MTNGKTLCLNMIVKNEMANLDRCLRAVADHIACWVIGDTGSTDGTQDFIQSFFAERGIPGELHSFPFLNFEQARNAALDHAAESKLAYDYLLLDDADMELVVEDRDFRAKLEEPGYRLIQRTESSLTYWNTRLVRRETGARYRGVTHEYLDVPGGVKELRGVWYKDHASGGSRGDKFERDIRLLTQALKTEPENHRYWFYLAQSYRDAGKKAKAAEIYAKRAAMGGWDEEAWNARLEQARCLRDLKDDDGFVREALAAFNQRPQRAEPLFDLARFHRERGNNAVSTLFSEYGLTLQRPDDILFLEDFVYTAGLREEYSIAANYAKDPARKDRGFAACNWLALSREIPEHTRSLAVSNLHFYVQAAATIMPSFTARPVAFAAPAGYRPTNPSVTRRGNEMVLVQRTVNYAIDPAFPDGDDRRYSTPSGEPIATRNFLLRLDDSFAIRSSVEILPPADMPKPAWPLVRGFEDVRPFVWRDGLWCIACVREFTREGWCEQVLARIDETAPGQLRFAERRVLHPEGPRRHEKNWMPLVDNDRLEFIYLCDPTCILDEHGKKIAESVPPIMADQFRGGSQAIAFDGGWLAVVHEVRVRDEQRFYRHRFVWLDSDRRLRGVSRPFFLQAYGVEFAAGLVWHPDGKRLVISYGVADTEAWIATVDAEDVRRLLLDAERLPSGVPYDLRSISSAEVAAANRNGFSTSQNTHADLPNRAENEVAAPQATAVKKASQAGECITSPRETPPRFSLVICSRNRATQLAATLGKLDLGDLTRNAVEVNLVDSASTDSTHEVMREFKEKSSFPVSIGRAHRVGVGLARNIGIEISTGDVIVFTDDDCYIDANYFTKLSALWDGRSFQYGGGQILMHDASLDPRVANLMIERREEIPPNTILVPGFIQGANMFFDRKVFQQAGSFNEQTGAGTPFACNDIEMATRASMHGFRGVRLPELKISHNHGRKRGSIEADQTADDYDFGRGAYYASLIVSGYRQASELPTMVKRPREMEGAQRYFDFVAQRDAKGPLPTKPDAFHPSPLRRTALAEGSSPLAPVGSRASSTGASPAALEKEESSNTNACDALHAENASPDSASAMPQRNKISGLVISYNRADVIEACLRSLRFVDELIVVDKTSTDGALEIARRYADKVVVVPWTPVVEDTRDYALSLCSHDLIVYLDDDECLSADAIRFILNEAVNPNADIYQLPSRDYYLGHFDKRRRDWPDYKPRFFRRGALQFTATVHGCPPAKSRNEHFIPADSAICLHHLTSPSVGAWVEKANRYTSQPNRDSWFDKSAPLSEGFVQQRLDYWFKNLTHSPDEYPSAYALMRVAYDIVDRLKRWEAEVGVDGEQEFANLCTILNQDYDTIGLPHGKEEKPSLAEPFDAEARVNELARTLRELLQDRPIALLDWPNHDNSGDHFLWLGEKIVLKQLAGLNVVAEYASDAINFQQLCDLPPSAALVFHGGGNFGDIYERHQRLREATIAAFPDRRIVLMPQSVHYRSQARLQRSTALLRQHPDLHVMARDSQSLRVLEEKMGLRHCYLHIDPAFALQKIVDELVSALSADAGPKIVRLMRRDRESIGTLSEPAEEAGFDWAEMPESPDFARIDVQAISSARGTIGSDFDLYSWDRLCKAVQLFAGAEQIITDRLHGHILAMLMRRPHRLYDNNYGKNLAFYRTWTSTSRLVDCASVPRSAEGEASRPEEPEQKARIQAAPIDGKAHVPRVFHFITGLDPNFGGKPFSLVHCLAIRSALLVNDGFRAKVYCHYEPAGRYWDAVKNDVEVIHVDLPTEVFGNPVEHFAHKADVLRMQILLEHGGIYLDLDTICQRPFEPLLDGRVVMGREERLEGDGSCSVVGLCNATIIAPPDAEFLRLWYETYREFSGGTTGDAWNRFSVQIPRALAQEHPDLLRVEPASSFFWPSWDSAGIASMFSMAMEFPKAYSFHLWESQAWDKVKDLSAHDILTSDTTYNRIARRFIGPDLIDATMSPSGAVQ